MIHYPRNRTPESQICRLNHPHPHTLTLNLTLTIALAVILPCGCSNSSQQDQYTLPADTKQPASITNATPRTTTTNPVSYTHLTLPTKA